MSPGVNVWVLKRWLALTLWLRLLSPLPVCLLIIIMVVQLMCRNTRHISSTSVFPFRAFCHRKEKQGPVGFNVFHACESESEHDINMFICTCARLSCMSLLYISLSGSLWCCRRESSNTLIPEWSINLSTKV